MTRDPEVPVVRGSLEDPRLFRVLVVDDEKRVRDTVFRQLESLENIVVVAVGTQAGAIDCLARHYFHVAIIDLELDTPAGGNDVIQHIGANFPMTDILVATKHVDPESLRALFGVVFDPSRRVRSVVDKNDPPVTWAKAVVTPLHDDWDLHAVEVHNLEVLLAPLMYRAGERRIAGLRDDRVETEVELRSLLKHMFGRVTGLQGRRTELTLAPLEREGLSSSVACEARVRMGEDESGHPIEGNRCVVKVGPARDLLREAERFERFVRFGVRLAHRVEMLGSARSNALAGIAYTFAGGVFSDEIVALDALFTESDPQAVGVLEKLFDPFTKNWYGVDAGVVVIRDYFEEEYKTKFAHCYLRLHNSILAASERHRHVETSRERGGVALREAKADRDGYVEIGKARMTIPKTEFRGDGLALSEQRCCFVHGDMHGGNVLVERHRPFGDDPVTRDASVRVCLIDFQNAGKGPRTIDAVQLEGSLRLADARIICQEVRGGESEEELSPQEEFAALTLAIEREQQEYALLRKLWRATIYDEWVGTGKADWQSCSAAIVAGVRTNFSGLEAEEYLVTGALAGLRLLGYELGVVERVRLLAWLSAQYKFMKKALKVVR